MVLFLVLHPEYQLAPTLSTPKTQLGRLQSQRTRIQLLFVFYVANSVHDISYKLFFFFFQFLFIYGGVDPDFHGQ